MNVPLQPSKEGGFNFYKSADEIVLPPPDKLDAFRSLIGGAKVGNVTIGDGAAEVRTIPILFPASSKLRWP